VVVAIWVFILAKLFWPSQAKSEGLMIPVQKKNQVKALQTDTYELKLLNKNPFNIKYTQSEAVRSSIKKPIHLRIPVSYVGYLSKPDKSAYYANVLYQQRFFILKEKDSIGDYRIERIYKDSLLISFQRHFKYIHRNP
jgi:hypothetical protein